MENIVNNNIEEIVKRIDEEDSLDEIATYLDIKPLSNEDITALVTEYVYRLDLGVLKAILKSKTFQRMKKNYLDECGYKIVQSLIMALSAVCLSEEITEDRKIDYKNQMIPILLDDSLNLDWNIWDFSYDTPLNMLIQYGEIYTEEEILSLVAHCLKNKVSPLTKNANSENAFILLNFSTMKENIKQSVFKLLSNSSEEAKLVLHLAEISSRRGGVHVL
jgi:hypothetical protein